MSLLNTARLKEAYSTCLDKKMVIYFQFEPTKKQLLKSFSVFNFDQKSSSILLALLMGFSISCAYAGPTYDFGDAPIPYGEAWHYTAEWQRLGTEYSKEKEAVAEDDDDGVSWSTDGGLTFGNGNLVQGQTVTFKFDFTRGTYGRHDYDELKAWVDWNGDYEWSTSEIIAQELWYKDTVEWGDTQINRDDYLNGVESDPNAVLYREILATIVVPEDSMGELWLRARVVCDESIYKNNVDGILNPTGFFHQGEAEDYKLTVTSVPEPSSLALLIMGLAISFIQRKK
ncbi:PEP-CTERM sorting domain-containing protein [Oceanicoccus sagamiensis]|uniref:GEVED domain-containing protein n=1 Tax=Oceanicoccus sagamiensis TaxID=716816 RepID=A0A1X9NAU8_9GAMM|nr:PEP-CTERM sorting domain-containing protein [Oceanicoccus sagamiensis]ARN74281.1 hypothetical protein BST96_09190 [Oceanicoccus sagamiensis]